MVPWVLKVVEAASDAAEPPPGTRPPVAVEAAAPLALPFARPRIPNACPRTDGSAVEPFVLFGFVPRVILPASGFARSRAFLALPWEPS